MSFTANCQVILKFSILQKNSFKLANFLFEIILLPWNHRDEKKWVFVICENWEAWWELNFSVFFWPAKICQKKFKENQSIFSWYKFWSFNFWWIEKWDSMIQRKLGFKTERSLSFLWQKLLIGYTLHFVLNFGFRIVLICSKFPDFSTFSPKNPAKKFFLFFSRYFSDEKKFKKISKRII